MKNNFQGILNFSKGNFVSVMNYGGVAIENFTGTKKIPFVEIDTRHREDLKELFRIHRETPPGDAVTQWTVNRKNKKSLLLSFKFERPSRVEFFLLLDLCKHSWVIEGMMVSKMVMLSPYKPLSETKKIADKINDSILIEIGANTEIPVDWREWQRKEITKTLRKSGLGRKDAKFECQSLVDSNFEFWSSHVDYSSSD